MPDTRDVAVRTFLQHMAVEVPAPSTPTPTLLRRARRGIAARVGGVALALVLIASGVAAGVASLRASSETPADPSNHVDLRVTARIEVKPTPTSLVAGAGSLWVSHSRLISRIDPASNTVVDTIEILPPAGGGAELGEGASSACVQAVFACGVGGSSDSLWELAFGDGAIWVTSSDGGGQVLRVDAVTDEVGATIDVPGAFDIAYDAGAVWVTGSSQGTGTLVRIDPTTNRPADPLVLDAEANAMTVGGGSVWIALDGGPILRIDPSSVEPQTSYDPEVDGIHDLAFDGGALWAATEGTIVRLDAATGAVVETPVRNPQELAIGDRAIWVSAYDSNEVLVLDPSSGSVIGTIVVGDSPNGKAFLEGTMWVALDLEHAVLGLEAHSG